MADQLQVEEDEITLTGRYGAADGLASIASITLVLKRPDGSAVSRIAIFDDVATGLFHFDLVAGDMKPGLGFYELRFVTTGGQTFTAPTRDPVQLFCRKKIA